MPDAPRPTHVRAFVAASLPPELLRGIEAHQHQLKRELGPISNQVRWTSPSQIHLTLRFFGNVPFDHLEPLRHGLERAVGGIGPMELVLRGFGCFPSAQRPSVIWIGLEGDIATLAKLQAQVEQQSQSFGSHAESRMFHPHLTIGRVRAPGTDARKIGAALQRQEGAELGRWQVRDIALIQSQLSPRGSVYTSLAAFSFGK